MALWIVRAGKSGEYERKFLADGRVFLTWESLNVNLEKVATNEKLIENLNGIYNGQSPNTVRNWANQIWAFSKSIQKDDWIALPSKFERTIHFGKVTGTYVYDSHAGNPYYHSIKVDWFAPDIPRTTFDQDILNSFGAFLTVCRISRNNAEERIKTLFKNGWKASHSTTISTGITPDDSQIMVEPGTINLEETANDQIAEFIERRFAGHGLTRIIEGILKAKGFTVYRSPEGPDNGVDLLAAPEPYGFGSPKICIQVKSGNVVVDRPTLDQLVGVMTNVHAEQGILVSWGGFKQTVKKEERDKFFKVRFWGQKEIIAELLENYSKLNEDLKAEIPLKQVWTVVVKEN